MKVFNYILIALISFVSIQAYNRLPLATTFRNPIKPDGPDPQIEKFCDTYYFTVTR